jgi:uncharacterized protein (TIGR00730 family)
LNIAVLCSAYALDERYAAPARAFARLLGECGHTLVWGGATDALMGVIADEVKEAGGKLIGISVEHLSATRYQGSDEMVVCPTLSERKALLLSRADAVVVLVGGLGTLDEVTEVMELKKHGMFDRPIVFLDPDGFYDGLRTQLNRMEAEGFLPHRVDELAYFTRHAAEALACIKKAHAELLDRRCQLAGVVVD